MGRQAVTVSYERARVNVTFDELAAAKSRVAVSHERLADAAAAEEIKAWWRKRLRALKPLLEG